MRFEGGCYCKAVRYVADGEPMMRAQCLCRECQYISGGSPNVFMAMPIAGFTYVQGQPRTFTRTDIERPVTREFCGDCGTPLTARSPGFPAVILKVGTMDNPADYGKPDIAIYGIDRQPFHCIAEGMPVFERLPG
ncbi:MAG: GFA family protein [Caulobacter sp.]|jgi:hypothetical protein